MKVLFYIILLLTLPCLAKAQSNAAYKGGSGDGYASAMVEGVSMNIDGSVKGETYKIYPNPAAQNEDVNIISDYSLIEHVKISDISGKEVYSFRPMLKHYSLKTANLNPGAYVLVIQMGGETSYRKLIVY